MQTTNNIHPTVKFTCSHSSANVPFLYVLVSLNNGTIDTDLYTKPTDKHQHLLQRRLPHQAIESQSSLSTKLQNDKSALRVF